jgi:hypothetical protein
MNKLVKATELKPGMICVDMGYTDIILTIVVSFQLVHLKFLNSVGTIGRCTYPSTSNLTIYDPS